MPLLQDLSARILDAKENGLTVPTEVERMMRDNFAHALSYLEQAKPWITEADNLRHRALFLDISNAIARDLEETVARAGDELGARPPPWLERLIVYWHQHRCTVLTLNYDTLVECVAANVKFPGDRRIQAADLYPVVLTDAALRYGRASHEPTEETFRLLKLHGSTNWYYSGRAQAYGEPIFFVPPLRTDADDTERGQHERRVRAVADKYPFLVPPVYDKSPLLTHETIRALWFEAGEALRRADKLVCMGYSLPESDLTMMHFLRTKCRSGARIELVNQSAQAIKNFSRLFQSTHATVHQAASGESSIADFVEHLAPEKSARG